MASNLNIVLSSAILQVIQNTDSTFRVNSPISVTLPGANALYYEYLPIATGAGTLITLPTQPIWVACIVNLGGLNGSPAGNITIQYSVPGQSLITVGLCRQIVPGGIDFYFNPTEGAGTGVQNMTLFASIANTPVRALFAA